MYIEEKQLRMFLKDFGLVSRADFEETLKEADQSGESAGTILVKKGKLSSDDLRRVQAYVLGIPFVDLKNQQMDFEVLSLIPEPIARAHNIVAFKKGVGALEVAMLDTDDLAAIDFVHKKVNLKILPRLTDSQSIKSALLQYQRSLKAEFGDIIQKESEALKDVPDGTQADAGELKKIAEDLPVVRTVDTLIKHAVLQNASDIHIEPTEHEVIVRYRIDGILHDAMILPRHAAGSIIARIKVLANLKLDEKKLPQDGRFSVESDGENVSFRVSTLPTYFGEKAALRLLKKTAQGFTLEGLGFHGDGLERVHRALKQRAGMILATGPTGSGKTTTLYTMLDILNMPEVNISTIEDPIEYQIPRINQTQIKPERGYTFGTGLRALLRQDPDIIMVGEIRDLETAALAVNAALTGHLVLSTLHTSSAAGAIPRLLDFKIEPFLLVSTVKVIIAQRLIRCLCDIKEKYFLTKAGMAALGKSTDLDRILRLLKEEHVLPHDATFEKVPFYRPKPTAECKDGYSGRIGIHEVLQMSPSVKELIMRGATAAEIEVQAEKEGMLTTLDDGLFKCAQGITAIEEVLRVVSE